MTIGKQQLRAATVALLLFFVPLFDSHASSVKDKANPINDNKHTAYEWRNLSIFYPVHRQDLSGSPPFIAAKTRTWPSNVSVTQHAGALVWIDKFAIAKVSVTSPNRAKKPTKPIKISAYRVQSTESKPHDFSLSEEVLYPDSDGSWRIYENQGMSGAWVLYTNQESTMQVHKLVPQPAPVDWENIEQQTLRWIANKIELPKFNLPLEKNTDLEQHLRLDHQIAESLLRSLTTKSDNESSLAKSVLAWRKASAMRKVLQLRPLRRPSIATKSLEKKWIPGRSITPIEHVRQSYQRVASPAVWSFSLKGPAVFVLEIRPLLDQKELLQSQPQENFIQVESQGRLLFRKSIARKLAQVRTSDSSPRSLPPRAPVSISTGEWLGQSQKLRIPISSNSHRYTIRFSGPPSLIKLSHSVPIARASAALRENTLDQQIQTAKSYLKLASDSEDNIAIQHFLHVLIEELDGLPPKADFASFSALPAFLQIYFALRIAVRPENSVRERHDWALRAMMLSKKHTSLDKYPILRNRVAQVLLDLGDSRSVRQLLRKQSSSAPSSISDKLTVLAISGDSNPNSASRKLASIDALRKTRPLNRSIQSQRMRTWWRETRWRRIDPELTDNYVNLSWIETSKTYRNSTIGPPKSANKPVRSSRSDFWHLVPEKTYSITIPPSVIDSRRKAVIELYSFSTDGSSHPISIEIDGERWLTTMDASQRPTQFAISAGHHQFKFEYSRNVELFIRLPPLSSINDQRHGYPAKKIRMWPLNPGDQTTTFSLPPRNDPGFMRLDLKLLHSPSQKSDYSADFPHKPNIIDFIVHSDVGPPKKFSARFSTSNSEIVFPIDTIANKTPHASRTVSVVLPIPPLAEKIWIETVDSTPSLATSLFIRSPKTNTTRTNPLTNSSPRKTVNTEGIANSNLSLLAQLSRTIQHNPQDLTTLFARAQLLLELDESRYAREDFFRIAEQLNYGQKRQVLRLLELLEHAKRRQEPRFVATPKLEQSTRINWLGPFSREIFEKFPELNPYRSQIASALHLESSGQPLKAALLWAKTFNETDQLEVGLACANSFLVAWQSPELDWHNRHADIAFGVSSRLRTLFDSTTVRKLQLLASMTSKWKTISNVQSSGGKERIISPYRLNQDSPNEWIRMALAPAPWPAKDATLLRPGKASTLAITARQKKSVDVAIWCTRSRRYIGRHHLHSESSVESHAALHLSHNTDRTQKLHVENNQSEYETLQLAPGPNRISIGLEKTRAYWLCSIRFSEAIKPSQSLGKEERRTLGPAILGQRTRSWLIAKPHQPVEFTILGPTTLELQSRTNTDRPSRSITIEATAENGHISRRVVTLSRTTDPHSKSTLRPSPPLSSPTKTQLILPEKQNYSIRVHPDQKHAWIYLRRRVPTSKAPRLPRHGPLDIDVSKLVAAHNNPPPQLQIPAPVDGSTPQTWGLSKFGTISTQLRFGIQDIPDIDTQFHRQLATVDFAWRKGFIPQSLWIRLNPWVGFQQPMLLGSGMKLTLLANRLPGRVRLTASTSVATQGISGRQAWSLRSSLFLQRSFRLASSWSLVPRVGFRYFFAPTHTRNVGAWYSDWLHSEVYTEYRNNHPMALLPGWILRWQPWQAFRWSSTATIVPNSDFLGLDRIDHNLDLRHLIDPYVRNPIGLLHYRVGYQSSLRLQDSDRDRTFLRHRLQASLTWNLWVHNGGRVSLAFSDAVYFVSGTTPFNVFLISLRHDATTDPLLRDFNPNETLFSIHNQQRRRNRIR